MNEMPSYDRSSETNQYHDGAPSVEKDVLLEVMRDNIYSAIWAMKNTSDKQMLAEDATILRRSIHALVQRFDTVTRSMLSDKSDDAINRWIDFVQADEDAHMMKFSELMDGVDDAVNTIRLFGLMKISDDDSLRQQALAYTGRHDELEASDVLQLHLFVDEESRHEIPADEYRDKIYNAITLFMEDESEEVLSAFETARYGDDEPYPAETFYGEDQMKLFREVDAALDDFENEDLVRLEKHVRNFDNARRTMLDKLTEWRSADEMARPELTQEINQAADVLSDHFAFVSRAIFDYYGRTSGKQFWQDFYTADEADRASYSQNLSGKDNFPKIAPESLKEHAEIYAKSHDGEQPGDSRSLTIATVLSAYRISLRNTINHVMDRL